MRVLSDEELEEGRDQYKEQCRPVRYWKVPREIILALFDELTNGDDANADADHVRLYPYLTGHGERAHLAARATSKDEEPCGQTYNDIRPCPPFCE